MGRFTKEAQQSFIHALKEARRLKHPAVEPEHMLLGALRVPESAAAALLQKRGIDPASLASAVEADLIPGHGEETAQELAFSPDGRRVLENVIGAGLDRHAGHFGTEHLLFGVACLEGGIAARRLADVGLTRQALKELLAATGPGPDPSSLSAEKPAELSLYKPEFPHLLSVVSLLRLFKERPRATLQLLASYRRSIALWAAGILQYRRERARRRSIQATRRRRLYFKLPLRQTEFHWVFNDRQAFLAGTLTLTVSRPGEEERITVFDKGVIDKGWAEIDGNSKRRRPQEIYFGFASRRKFQVSPADSVRILLEVINDLEGEGPHTRGVLKAGRYETVSRFTIYEPHGTAYTGDKKCEPLWNLDVTENRGWMSGTAKTE